MVVKIHLGCASNQEFVRRYHVKNTGDCKLGGQCMWCQSGANASQIIWAHIEPVQPSDEVTVHRHGRGERAVPDECNFLLGPDKASENQRSACLST